MAVRGKAKEAKADTSPLGPTCDWTATTDMAIVAILETNVKKTGVCSNAHQPNLVTALLASLPQECRMVPTNETRASQRFNAIAPGITPAWNFAFWAPWRL
jgi:hypothetical protein